MVEGRRINDEAILTEMKYLRKDFSNLDKRIAGMETAINLVAVQKNQIYTIQGSVETLWKTNSDLGKDIIELKKFQASCPRPHIEKMEQRQKDTLGNQWTAIKILAGSMLTGFAIMAALIKGTS